MKKILTILTLCSLLSPLAYAMPSALKERLAQQGITLPLQPPVDVRCTMSAGGGEVDYGRQSRGQLQDIPGHSNVLTPGKRTIALTITCPSQRQMRMTLLGMKAANGSLRYGESGAVMIQIHNASVDGHPVMLATAMPGEQQVSAEKNSLSVKPGQKIVAVHNGQVVTGSTLTAQLNIVPIMPQSATRVTAPAQNDAHFALVLQE